MAGLASALPGRSSLRGLSGRAGRPLGLGRLVEGARRQLRRRGRASPLRRVPYGSVARRLLGPLRFALGPHPFRVDAHGARRRRRRPHRLECRRPLEVSALAQSALFTTVAATPGSRAGGVAPTFRRERSAYSAWGSDSPVRWCGTLCTGGRGAGVEGSCAPAGRAPEHALLPAPTDRWLTLPLPWRPGSPPRAWQDWAPSQPAVRAARSPALWLSGLRDGPQRPCSSASQPVLLAPLDQLRLPLVLARKARSPTLTTHAQPFKTPVSSHHASSSACSTACARPGASRGSSLLNV